MAQKPVLRGEVGCACVAREVSVEHRASNAALVLKGVAFSSAGFEKRLNCTRCTLGNFKKAHALSESLSLSVNSSARSVAPCPGFEVSPSFFY